MKTAREKFEGWILASIVLHVSVVLLIFVAPTLFVAHPVNWGSANGGSGGINVKIVTGFPGISLPAPPAVADDTPNTESKSLYKPEPAPKTVAPAPDVDAVKLPSRNAPSKPETKPAATKNTDKPSTAPSNAVAYGADGGSPNLRYGQSGQGGPIGAEFGNGTFGTQFGTYVESMKRIIADAWTSTGMSQQRSPRVYVTFRIKRNGEIIESQLEKPTDNPTLVERAALQAIRRAKLQPLPSEYHGDEVAVRFYFDYVQ